MPSPVPPLPRGRRTSRRVFLLGVGAFSLAGCTLDQPTVQSTGTVPSRAPSSAPAADPVTTGARTAELAMAGWLAGLVRVASSAKVPAATLPVLAAIRDAHLEHARALAGWTAGTSSPSASAAPSAVAVRGQWHDLSAQLAQREKALAARHRADALATSDASTALLFCSLSTFAAAAASPAVAPAHLPVQPARVDAGTRTDALQVLLSQLRALAQGLQHGAGQLPTPSALFDPALARLTQVWAARDATEQAILQSGGTIAAPLTSYQMPGGFSGAAAIQHTWGRLELAVLNAWGRVAAASSGANRTHALDEMVQQSARVRADGVALPWWPGWA